MNLLCKSIFALLAFYIVFSECIELPQTVKKNKNLFYLLIGGFYLYSYQNDKIEGLGILSPEYLRWVFLALTIVWACVFFWAFTKLQEEPRSVLKGCLGVLCGIVLMVLIAITGAEFGNKHNIWM